MSHKSLNQPELIDNLISTNSKMNVQFEKINSLIVWRFFLKIF